MNPAAVAVFDAVAWAVGNDLLRYAQWEESDVATVGAEWAAGSGRSEVQLHDGTREVRTHLALLGGLGEGHGKEKEARLHRAVGGRVAWLVLMRRALRAGRGRSDPPRPDRASRSRPSPYATSPWIPGVLEASAAIGHSPTPWSTGPRQRCPVAGQGAEPVDWPTVRRPGRHRGCWKQQQRKNRPPPPAGGWCRSHWRHPWPPPGPSSRRCCDLPL